MYINLYEEFKPKGMLSIPCFDLNFKLPGLKHWKFEKSDVPSLLHQLGGPEDEEDEQVLSTCLLMAAAAELFVSDFGRSFQKSPKNKMTTSKFYQ